MKHLEHINQCSSSCYRESVSFIDKNNYQVAYQKVYIFSTNEWRWLTFFGDMYSDDYPQGHASLDDMRKYIKTQKPIPEAARV